MTRRHGAAERIGRRAFLAAGAGALVLGLTSCAGGSAEQLRKPLESAHSSVATCLLGLTLYAEGALTLPSTTTLIGDMTRDLRDAATTAAESGSGVDSAVYHAAVTAIRDAADAAASAHATLPQHPDTDVDALHERLSSASDQIDAALASIGGGG